MAGEGTAVLRFSPSQSCLSAPVFRSAWCGWLLAEVPLAYGAVLCTLSLLGPTGNCCGFINHARALSWSHLCQAVRGDAVPAQDGTPGHSASSPGRSQAMLGGGFPPRGTLMTLDVPAYQLRPKDWAQQEGGNPAGSAPLGSVRHSRDSEQDRSAHNPLGEERELAVISTLKIGIIHFASPNPFPGHLNTSSQTTSVFITHHFLLSPNFYDNFCPWFISNRIF